MTQFLALITVIGGQIDNSLPGGQPGVNPPLFPSNPIAPGGTTPPWGPGMTPRPPTAGQGPGFPTNPIAPGGPGGSGGGGMVPPPVAGIPIFPGQLPGGRPGGEVDNTLPGGLPGMSNPISGGFVLMYHPQYGWVLVSGSGSASGGGSGGPGVDNTLPGAQPGVDNELPGDQPKPDNTLPKPRPQPK